MYVLVYATLLIAVGAITIDNWNHVGNSKSRDKALAMGSMAVIGGSVMLVDFALILKSVL